MPEKSIILNRTNHIINTGELTIDKFIYYTRRTPWLWIKVQTQRVDQETHTHIIPCRWGSADGEKENIPEGFSFKKNAHTSWAVPPSPPSRVSVFSFQEYHFAIPFLVSFPLFGHRQLERRLRPSDLTQVQSGTPGVCNGVCSCQILLCSRGSFQSNSTT